MNEVAADAEIEGFLREAFAPCVKCHMCNIECPICDSVITKGSYGINRSIYYALEWGEYNEMLRNIVYSCTTCGKCMDICKNISKALPLLEIFERTRELLLVEKMIGPMPEQRNVLKNMHIRGNPWGYPHHERTKWAEGLGIDFFSKDKSLDVLYFVGCACSYDLQAQKIAKNLSKILKHAGITFGILEKEVCSGSEARRMGEIGLFQYLCDANVEMFENAQVECIMTGDPHSFYTFLHEYKKIQNKLKVYHYTQFINELISERKLRLSSNEKLTVTYHDPCYLGRRSGVFNEPRELIQRIPGVTFVEMEKSRENSDCCGMGGGRMWMEPPRGFISSQTMAKKRVEQAIDTKAELLLTACPFCNIALTDGSKLLNAEDTIKVMDITELISMCL